MYRAKCKTYPKCIYSFDEIEHYISIGNLLKVKQLMLFIIIGLKLILKKF